MDFEDKTLIDLGCGFGRWGHLLRSEVDKHTQSTYMIGCDIYRPCLEETRKYNPYDDLVVCDLKHLPFRERVFDIALALEVIEHLPKKVAMSFLTNLETCCKGLIVISTPHGFYSQDESRGNIFEKHLSSWKPKDFQENGYATIVTGFGSVLESACRKTGILKILIKLNRIRLRGQQDQAVIFGFKVTKR
jgi:2-polyprenyl-3-methyl-5-hydroxy-6-metoxy-1,4-benzoquinol methylase